VSLPNKKPFSHNSCPMNVMPAIQAVLNVDYAPISTSSTLMKYWISVVINNCYVCQLQNKRWHNWLLDN
jgi:hypothetical protein